MDSDLKIGSSLIEKPGGKWSLKESLGLREREVISLVGAGGKTTLMFRLARELLLGKKKVLTTTTTKILEPVQGETVFLFVDRDEGKIREFVHRHLGQYGHITVATERLGAGKLKGISAALAMELWNSGEIEYLIIEADGASGKPVKAPRQGEPVIPLNTTLVVAILGADGVGRDLAEEGVFRPEIVSRITGIPMGGRMTEEAMAILMTHEEGIFKGAPSSSRVVAFLNKVDIHDGMTAAKRMGQKILQRRHPRIERVVLGQVKHDPPVAEVLFE